MSETFRIIDSGFVFDARKETSGAVACGPRLVAGSREILCSFMLQSALGINDFKPVIVRSYDARTWSSPVMPWKHLSDTYSIFGSLSRSPSGELFFFGTRTKIDIPGESFWSEETQGLKENELIYSYSTDNARKWSQLLVIPKPVPGAAEAAGAMCITKSGSWHVCYSPYNTFDPDLYVERNQVVLLTSTDRGKTWKYTRMLKFDEEYVSAAEAWVIELADTRLFGTCWKINLKDGSDFPNPYSISTDDGNSWQTVKSTNIHGQTPSVCPLPDNRILFIYNQRRVAPYGIRLALASVSEMDFIVEADEIIYRAVIPEKGDFAVQHSNWTGFNFGEPHVAILPDRTIVAVFWCLEKKQWGIRYIILDGKNLI